MPQSTDSPRSSFADLRARWVPQVEELIITVAHQSSPLESSLVSMAEYHLATGGKRIRAMIPLAVAECLNVDPARILGFGAACEMLHNATLVHDDVQDGDEVRRGEPTVWAKWGVPRAINLGDAMLYWTFALLAEVDFDAEAKQRLTQRIVRDTLQVIDGQEREFLMQSEDRPDLQMYFRMVSGKTSGLFSLPLAGAAELCGASPSIVDGLVSAAGHLGVVFQLQDDVLDLYGEKGRGQRGSDLGEGKVSALVAHFLEHAPDEEARWLSGVLEAPRSELTSEAVERAADLFRERGSLAYALEEIRRRTDLALCTAAVEEQARLRELVHELAALFLEPIKDIG